MPPYNGFGNEEDSLGYVYRLIPKPPKKDHFKYVDNEKDILRYTAKLNTTVPEDIERRFILLNSLRRAHLYMSHQTIESRTWSVRPDSSRSTRHGAWQT